jgi:hypothetical protein
LNDHPSRIDSPRDPRQRSGLRAERSRPQRATNYVDGPPEVDLVVEIDPSDAAVRAAEVLTRTMPAFEPHPVDPHPLEKRLPAGFYRFAAKIVGTPAAAGGLLDRSRREAAADRGQSAGEVVSRVRFSSANAARVDVPIEIRRPNMALAARVFSSADVDLVPGTYFVTALLPTCDSITKRVEVKESTSANVVDSSPSTRHRRRRRPKR